MKKIVNRVLCMLFAVVFLVLSVAELSVVSAESGESSGGTVKLYPSEEEASKISPPINRALIDSIYNKYKYTGSDSNNSYPHYVFNPLYDPYIGKKCLFDISDYKQCIDFAIYLGYCNGVFMFRQEGEPKYYYYAYVSTDIDYINVIIYCSKNLLYFKTTDNKKFRLYSEPWVQECRFTFENNNGTSSVSYSDNFEYSNVLESSSRVAYLSSCTSYMSTIDEIRDSTNSYERLIIPFQSGDFPNFLSEADKSGVEYYDGVKFSPAQLPLKDQIEVKLTPEFGIDMDRVFDKNTGQNDYFKFEVTNNSDKNIQFCASIIDEKNDTLKDALSGTILDGLLQFDYEDWEDAYWNYITDGQHYVDCYEQTKKGFLGKKFRRYSELQKGNFYWVFLKPGDHFEDFIYWENVKIVPYKKYSFIVDFIPTELDYSTDVFYGLTGDVKVFPYPDEIKDDTGIDDYEKDSTLERYALNYKECECVYNQVFSVTSIPDFSTTVRGGNAKITSGWKDTVVQSNNPYYRQDMSTGEIKPVDNYSEFKGSLDDVNVDLNNVKFEDVGIYITHSQQFFDLIKDVMLIFPSWVWVLVCFGLTGLIVIGIIKAIL